MKSKLTNLFSRLSRVIRGSYADELPPPVKIKLQTLFDPQFYKRRNMDVAQSTTSPFEHYLAYGRAEGRIPRADFDPSYYGRVHEAELAGRDPFVHWATVGKDAGYPGHPWISDPNIDDVELMREQFDADLYTRLNRDVVREGHEPFEHFVNFGWRDGRDPNAWFSINDYIELYPEVRLGGLNPFSHYVVVGRHENRKTMIVVDAASSGNSLDNYVYATLEENFDDDYYKSQFGDPSSIPLDLVGHYLTEGWLTGLNPTAEFNTLGYLTQNPDVAEAKINPYYHFLRQGKMEGRSAGLDYSATMDVTSTAKKPTTSSGAPYAEHQKFSSTGEYFEELDVSIARDRPHKAKVLAYYLPQFHTIPENDAWWGRGFTEWRNVVRGQPRFEGHFQPRVPGELGYYDLRDVNIMRRQAEMAKAAGIHGFCFYYYSFDGKRVLERPVDAFLATRDIDFPFALIWANENWTRTWDGLDHSILLEQTYKQENEGKLLADLARHFEDPRYLRVGGRPLFFIYRPGSIPDSRATIARWRKGFADQHNVYPLIFMCQGFNDVDPGPHGLDGALEFPPHKIAQGLAPENSKLNILDSKFSGHVINYDMVVERSIREVAPDYPLIKAACPSWDNEARRPARGMVLHGSTPEKYESWLRKLVEFAQAHPTFGDSFVGVNAWNEWAEGAYLEPDVYFGSAYLNATARAIVGSAPKRDMLKFKVVLVGHDAYTHGAQLLLLHIGEMLTNQFGVQVHFVICGDGPLLPVYRQIGATTKIDLGDVNGASEAIARLRLNGYRHAIVNTTVSGWIVPIVTAQGIVVTTLVHELATLIYERSLELEAANIARQSNTIVFPATMVRDSFLRISGAANGEVRVEPQGLYRSDLLRLTRDTNKLRIAMSLPRDAKVVINVGYADMRKGFDLFAKLARDICITHDDYYFLWVGDGTEDVKRWLLPYLAQGPLADRIRLTGFTTDIERYYAVADVFFLTSREDPFPSVVMEALAVGLPIVGFAGSGGTDDLISRYGRLVDQNDDKATIAAILDMAEEAGSRAEERRRHVETALAFDTYCERLMQSLYPEMPKVSVVVPNYNYARYLVRRLDSIFKQTLPIFEIIVLDDKSTDESVTVINRYAAEMNRTIRLVENEENSGSVFSQWRKGVELARGDYVWIAEADDDSDANFLELIAGRMIRDGAVLGFSDSWQLGTDGETLGTTYKNYVNQIEPCAFDSSFCVHGREFLSRFLSVKNVILNVSGVVFDRKALLSALTKVGDDIFSYAVAGDWRIYIELCTLDVPIVYEARALNGHRRHRASVTHTLKAEKHLKEIAEMQERAAERVSLTDTQVRRSSDYLNEVRSYLYQHAADPAPTTDQ